ncbi:MAG TPA: tRNA uridine-5-carboxymethylaminomethyl(34) synthesis GTPase MnmE [Thermodesulfobacteriota bacterium]|nr:tRNA uridine-5-carboxymethylaminomethyl(34) synthesis GTPase MnmE [Thermodesulfobacteriota bacterium]
MNRNVSSISPKNLPNPDEETIAAISTPFGESGIGIVRISGPSAEPIARKLFRPRKDQSYFISHRFHFGEIIDIQSGNPVDEVLIVLMKSPKTYTREDIAEIHCHGGYFVLQKVLELVLREGVRLAQPGEFTKRAFLKGRIDLTQAEAVIDLIKAKTQTSLEIATQQLRGAVYREMAEVKARLIENLSLMEAHIDFPEEEIEPIAFGKMRKDLEAIARQIEEWIDSYEEGRIFREGISCAIVGKTNVGKSSLLNVLLKEDRAIVTPIPGTTRDVIEEVLNIYGVPVRLMDTAGMRKPADSIEQEGVRRAKERVAGSDFVVLMLDGSRSLDDDDREIFAEIKGKKKVIAMNKNDLPLRTSLEEVKILFPKDSVISISALENDGIDDLKQAIYSSLIRREVRTTPEHLIVANIRHKAALTQVRNNLSNAAKGLEERVSLEFIAFEIRSSLEALGDLVGETATEEVLDRIFEKFCIGK